jgi:ureidoglycolate hydrolase
MVFVAEGSEGIAAVRGVSHDELVIYVENAGEFAVPRSAIRAIHDQKVILDAKKLNKHLLRAIGHVHDSEDPKLVG